MIRRRVVTKSLFALLLCLSVIGAGCGRSESSRFGVREKEIQSGPGSIYDIHREIQSGGLTRTYMTHVPSSYEKGSSRTALVLAFHGHGGEGAGMEKLSHLSEVADREGFIVVYPDGVDGGWNDGRQPPGQNTGVDDVGFTRDLVKAVESRYAIDPGRVYATGMSNGGFMCFRLACDAPDLIAAIAPVGALMGADLANRNTSTAPVSVLVVEGTDDPFVPWEGGAVGGGFAGRGDALSAAGTIEYWVKLDGCSEKPESSPLQNNVPDDRTEVSTQIYRGGRNGTEVELITVDGGGHTWPNGWQYLPRRIIGNTSTEIDASWTAWKFFDDHPKQL
jgi:polyhydroxybutyrate depolymerase